MVTREQFLNAISSYIEHDMLPKAEGNQKIVLRGAQVAIKLKPQTVFDLVKYNKLVEMFGVIDEHDNVDIDTLCTALSESLGSDEFVIDLAIFSKAYTFYFGAGDIQSIKRYL